MRKGYLSEYFQGVAVKRLSRVEVDPGVSNQHEFNGSKQLQRLFGEERRTYPARFIRLTDEDEGLSSDASVTWYDARENHPTRSEYRLYFKQNDVMWRADAEDLIILAKRQDETLNLIIVPLGSTVESQLLWLFGVEHIDDTFQFKPIAENNDQKVGFAVRHILEELGIEVDEQDESYLDSILEPHMASGFPSTLIFSELARTSCSNVDPAEDPDEALLRWLEHEERLFKRLEHHIVSKRLALGFYDGEEVDVESFIKFSLSVQNRRKSRVGYAFENHLEEIFKFNNIRYSRTQVTENKAKPDFIFPGIKHYQDFEFPESRLTMLGVKSSCKDRWRQVLSEADRIREKHLLTLEPGISENQTNEMIAFQVQLILPQRLHMTYKPVQQDWLLTIRDFIELVRERQ